MARAAPSHPRSSRPSRAPDRRARGPPPPQEGACHVPRARARPLLRPPPRAPRRSISSSSSSSAPRRPTRQQQQEEEEEGRPSRRRRPPPTSPRLSAPPRASRRRVRRRGSTRLLALHARSARHRCVQSYFARIYSSRSPRCCTRCGACAAAPSASLAASAASTSGASPRFSTLCDARRSTWSRPPKPGEAREMRRDCG